MADAISSLESKLLLFFFSEFALLLPLDRFFFFERQKRSRCFGCCVSGLTPLYVEALSTLVVRFRGTILCSRFWKNSCHKFLELSGERRKEEKRDWRKQSLRWLCKSCNCDAALFFLFGCSPCDAASVEKMFHNAGVFLVDAVQKINNEKSLHLVYSVPLTSVFLLFAFFFFLLYVQVHSSAILPCFCACACPWFDPVTSVCTSRGWQYIPLLRSLCERSSVSTTSSQKKKKRERERKKKKTQPCAEAKLGCLGFYPPEHMKKKASGVVLGYILFIFSLLSCVFQVTDR